MKRFVLPTTALLLMLLYLIPPLLEEGPEELRIIPKGLRIVGIEIKRGKEVYRLRKEDGGWKIEEPIEWKADSSRVEDLLRRLRGTRLENPITDREDRYREFDLGGEGDYIKLLAEGGETTLYTGKRGPTPSLIYVRREGDRNVYLINAGFADLIPQDINDLRDRTILSIPEEEIRKVSWEEGGERFEMVKREDGWYTSEGERLEDRMVSDYLRDISRIRATGFLKDDALPQGAERYGAIRISGDREVSLTLYRKDGEHYLVREGVPYRISPSLKERILRRPE